MEVMIFLQCTFFYNEEYGMTYSFSVLFRLYVLWSLVRYFFEAHRRLHFPKQTSANPGWSVMHVYTAPSVSSKTCSDCSSTIHFSISWQQLHSSAFCMKPSEQWPHLHLEMCNEYRFISTWIYHV